MRKSKIFIYIIAIFSLIWTKPLKAANEPSLIPMQKDYIKQDLETTPYYNSTERVKLEIQPLQGHLIDGKHHKLYSWTKRIFVIAADKKMYHLSSIRMFNLHHSSPVAGEDVVFAGNVKFRNGKIISIDNFSGHYVPNDIHFFNALIYLNSRGVLSENIKIFVTTEGVNTPPILVGNYEDFISFFKSKNPNLFKIHLCSKNYNSPYLHYKKM